MTARLDTAIIEAHPRRLARATSTADVLDRLAAFLRINVSAGDASEHTIRAYLIHIFQFADWCREAGIDAGRATESDLAEYRRYLVAEAGYKRSTVGVKLSAVRRFYDAAVWQGLRADNPAKGLKPPRDHTTRRDRVLERYLSPQEIDLLLAAPDLETTAGARDRAMMELMYRHGLRVSEVAALQLLDLKLSGQPQLHIRDAKGGKDRVVLPVVQSLQILDAWLLAREEIANQRSKGALFLSLSRAHFGAQITAPGARWVLNQYLEAVGLRRPGLSCHALRHAHASHALAGGADIHALAAEMGHASIETTTIYTHIVDAVRQNPAEFLALARE